MKRSIVVVFSAVLVLAACSSSSKSSSSSSSTTTASSTASSSSSAAAAAGATLTVSPNPKIAKPIVVDSAGKTVYMYEPNGTSTTSQVPSGIKGNWPAVTASGAPVAGPGIDQSKLAVDAQPDGTMQVAYNGHLLYTFVGDTTADAANGQGLGGFWFVVSPAGEKIS